MSKNRGLTPSGISLETPLPFQPDQISQEELEFFRSFDPAYNQKVEVRQQEPQINPALSYVSSFRQSEEKIHLNPELCYFPSSCDRAQYLIQREAFLIPTTINKVNTSINTTEEFDLKKISTSEGNIRQPVPIDSELTVENREGLNFPNYDFTQNPKNDYQNLQEERRTGLSDPQELKNQGEFGHILYTKEPVSAWDNGMANQNQVLNESYYQCGSYLGSICREDIKKANRLPEVSSSLDLTHKNSFRSLDLVANNPRCLSFTIQTKKDLPPPLTPSYTQPLSFTKNHGYSPDTTRITQCILAEHIPENQSKPTTPSYQKRNKKTYRAETGKLIHKRKFFGVDYFYVSNPDAEIEESVYSLPITLVKDKYLHLKKTIFYQLTRARADVSHKTVEEIIKNLKNAPINVKNKILFCILLSFTKKGFKDYYRELPCETIVDLLTNSPKYEIYSERSLKFALENWICYDFTTIFEGYHVLLQCFNEFYFDKIAYKSEEYMVSFKKHAFYCLRVFFQEGFKGENQ